MPKYEDLQFLESQIRNIGHEVEILEARGEKINRPPVPEQMEDAPEPDEVIDNLLQGDDLLKDIEEDFDEGLVFGDEEEADGGAEELEEDSFGPDLEESGFHNLSGEEDKSILTSPKMGEEPDWEALSDGSLDELGSFEDLEEPENIEDGEEFTEETPTEEIALEETGLGDLEDLAGEEPAEDTPTEEIPVEDLGDLEGMEDLLSTDDEVPAEEAGSGEMEDLLGGDFDLDTPGGEETPPVDAELEAMDDFLGGDLDADTPAEETPVEEAGPDEAEELLGGDFDTDTSGEEPPAEVADLEDMSDLLGGDFDTDTPEEETPAEEAGLEDMSDLLGGDLDTDTPDEEPPAEEAGLEDMSDLLGGDFDTDTPEEETPAEEADLEDMSDLLGGDLDAEAPEEETAPAEEAGLEDMSDLLSGDPDAEAPGEETAPENAGLEGMDDLLGGDFNLDTPAEETTSDEAGSGEMEDLLGGDFSLDTPEEETPPADAGSGEMEDLLGGDFSLDTPEEETPPADAGLGDMEDLLDGDLSVEAPADETPAEEAGLEGLGGMDDLLGGDFDTEASAEGAGELEGMEDLLGGGLEETGAGDELSDLSADLVDLSGEAEEGAGTAGPDGMDDVFSSIDLGDDGIEGELGSDEDGIDSFSLDSIDGFDEPVSEVEEDFGEIEEIDSDVEEIPDAEEHFEEAEEGAELILTKEERYKIVQSLSTLPKEAEIKIATAIIEGKLSDKQLKPLITSLIEGRPQPELLRIYQTITGDASLSKLTTRKYTGVGFEEQRKSFAYVFQRNIYPILKWAALVSVIIFTSSVLWLNVFWPRISSNMVYDEGIKLLNEENYTGAETKFAKANSILEKKNMPPNYDKVVDYAELYQDKKRYLAAEKKYETALDLKPNRKLKLQVGEFFRETGKYEKALSMYMPLLKKNDRDLKALLGTADTYLDWSEDEENKLEEAERYYREVLGVELRNEDAHFSLLKVYMAMDDFEHVKKTYTGIEERMPKKIRPDAFADLAGYLLDREDIDFAKDVLDKAVEAFNPKENFPELDYQLSRYKKYLDITDEEKGHLQNAKSRLEYMKKYDNERFQSSDKYQKMLARVYNNLGENLSRYSPINLEAKKLFKDAIDTDKDYGRPHFNLGNFALFNEVDFKEAMHNYHQAEKKGFSSDRMDYNLGWLYYQDNQFYESYKKINNLFTKNEDNNNLKFMIGTILYRLNNYDISESILRESHDYYDALKQMSAPLEMDVKDDVAIAQMLLKISNNLGATMQKQYSKTGKSKYLVEAQHFYTSSIEYYDILQDSPMVLYEDVPEKDRVDKVWKKDNSHLNLRMVLYPDTAKDDPVIFEEFPFEY